MWLWPARRPQLLSTRHSNNDINCQSVRPFKGLTASHVHRLIPCLPDPRAAIFVHPDTPSLYILRLSSVPKIEVKSNLDFHTTVPITLQGSEQLNPEHCALHNINDYYKLICDKSVLPRQVSWISTDFDTQSDPFRPPNMYHKSQIAAVGGVMIHVHTQVHLHTHFLAIRDQIVTMDRPLLRNTLKAV